MGRVRTSAHPRNGRCDVVHRSLARSRDARACHRRAPKCSYAGRAGSHAYPTAGGAPRRGRGGHAQRVQCAIRGMREGRSWDGRRWDPDVRPRRRAGDIAPSCGMGDRWLHGRRGVGARRTAAQDRPRREAEDQVVGRVVSRGACVGLRRNCERNGGPLCVNRISMVCSACPLCRGTKPGFGKPRPRDDNVAACRSRIKIISRVARCG